MPCLPESGGCERRFTDVLIEHLNRIEDAHYEYRACLDMTERAAAQPEVLYVDSRTGGQLVIERKSVSWPTDYAYRHSNDHVVGDVFSRELKDLATDDLYEVRLPMLIQGKRAELEAFALDAAKQVRANWATIADGGSLNGRGAPNRWWAFRRLPDWDREDDTPGCGMQISWVGRSLMTLDSFLDPENLPDVLSLAIQKIYTSCAAKFASYLDARRILLLDPHGDLQIEDADFWRGVWTVLPPPSEVGEVWSGVFDWITDRERDWTFTLLYPPST